MAINRYTTPVEQTLEKYVPVPMDSLYKAAEAIQERGDLAQQQVDQAQFGLASIAANPYHQDFVSQYANQFKNKATELLDKYQGNTSNPEFIRDSKRLSMQFASDPRLKAVQQAKLAYDQKENIKKDLNMKGLKYVDTGLGYNGLDENGQISANVGDIKTTDYDKTIASRIAQAASKMEQRGSLKSNQWNIEGTAKALKQQIFTDPELALGVQHLMQQGNLTEGQAIKTMNDYIDNVSKSMISSDIDHYEDSQAWDKFKYFDTRRREDEKAKQEFPPQVPFELLSYSKPITPNTNVDVARSETVSKLKETIDNLTSTGNLNSGNKEVPNTAENRKKYPKGIPKYIGGSGEGSKGGIQPQLLSINDAGYDPEEVALLNSARKFMGIKGGSAKEILTKYSKLLEDFDNSSNNIKTTDNVKINNASAEIARRQIASGEVYTVENGNLVKVADEETLLKVSNIDDKNISGISPKNLGALSGYTQFTDKEGKVYYTPIPQEYQKKFIGSKVVENYLQDTNPTNLKQKQVKFRNNDGTIKDMNVFLNPNQEAVPYVYKGVNGAMTPYKTVENGKIVAGGIFQTKEGYILLPLTEIENNEFKSLFTNITNNNKIEGN